MFFAYLFRFCVVLHADVMSKHTIFTTDFYSFLLYCVITPLSKVSGGLCTERHVNPPHYLCDIPKWGVCYQKLLLVCLLYLFFINWSSINRDDGFLFFIPSHFFMPMPFITNYTVWVVLIIECLVVFYIIGLWWIAVWLAIYLFLWS